MNIFNYIQNHTLISAIVIVVLFFIIRFYIWPKIRGDEPVKVDEPFNLNQYENTKEIK